MLFSVAVLLGSSLAAHPAASLLGAGTDGGSLLTSTSGPAPQQQDAFSRINQPDIPAKLAAIREQFAAKTKGAADAKQTPADAKADAKSKAKADAKQAPVAAEPYATLLKLQERFELDLGVPRLLLLNGSSAAARATFLQSLIGWNVTGPSPGKVASAMRCPIVWELVDSGASARAAVSVGSLEVEVDKRGEKRRRWSVAKLGVDVRAGPGGSLGEQVAGELAAAIKAHMTALEGYSSAPLWVGAVVVWMLSCWDLVVCYREDGSLL